MKPLSVEECSAILDAEIQTYTVKGFEIQSRTATTVQLVKHKRFSCAMLILWIVIGFLTIGFGLLIYFLLYTGKRDAIVFLRVDEKGQTWITEYGAYTRGLNAEPRLKYPTDTPPPDNDYDIFRTATRP